MSTTISGVFLSIGLFFGALMIPSSPTDPVLRGWSYSAPTETTTTTTTIAYVKPLPRDLETPDGESCPGWMDVAREVGWPEAELPMVGAVTYFEARCSNDVRGDSGVSWTAFQIHTKSWCRPTRYYPDGYLQTLGLVSTCDNLLDPATAARSALAIWEYGGWAPWTTSKMASTSLNQP